MLAVVLVMVLIVVLADPAHLIVNLAKAQCQFPKQQKNYDDVRW